MYRVVVLRARARRRVVYRTRGTLCAGPERSLPPRQGGGRADGRAGPRLLRRVGIRRRAGVSERDPQRRVHGDRQGRVQARVPAADRRVPGTGIAVAEVQVGRDGGVQTITLNRPDKLNAFTRLLHGELQEALEEARDPSVRAVVITGAGRGFSAGQDLTAFGEAGDVAAMLRATYHVNVLAIRSLEKPVIAAVNGVCAGAGLSLACACDIRLASDAAFFVPGFVGIGLVPDSGGTYLIQRLLGTARAFEWMTSNRRLTAAEAHAWGLVSDVVEADSFAARVAERAAQLAAAPTAAIALTKRLFDEAGTNTLEQQLELEADL